MLDDPVIAFRQIDRMLAAAQRLRKPVYIELPRDVVMAHRLPGAGESLAGSLDASTAALTRR